MPRNVLVVEDDADLAHLVQLQLQDIDCAATVIADGAQALDHLQSDARYDLVVLDIMLPGCDGLALCRALRGNDQRTPVLMLTAKSSELDRVLGLELGADDYLTKPFSLMELNARVKALLRRSDVSQLSEPKVSNICLGELRIDVRTRTVARANQQIALTAREFDLLQHFAQHPGQVFTREQLLKHVWGYSH
ncbi:MAG: response regulator transcription factor, partial [Pseudomonadota bacterium]